MNFIGITHIKEFANLSVYYEIESLMKIYNASTAEDYMWRIVRTMKQNKIKGINRYKALYKIYQRKYSREK